MNSAIEFHDSELTEIAREGDSVIIYFTSAYIHKSEGTPAHNPGTGWTQRAELIIGSGSIEGTCPDFPCRIADGKLECGDTVSDNLLHLPFECKGEIQLELIFATNSTVKITGENAVLHLQGEAQYIERCSISRRLTTPSTGALISLSFIENLNGSEVMCAPG